MKRVHGFSAGFVLCGLMFLLPGCKKESALVQPPPVSGFVASVNGFVQKGPFISGSAVTAYDLNSDLAPTGKTYNCQTTDNLGTFQLKNITLSSEFVGFRADGFYFNEVLGSRSDAPISLYALSRFSEHGRMNINLLTHLEKPRVEYLMSQEKTFEEAKKQAQGEILKIFDMGADTLDASESLDIALPGDQNAMLLAVSSILQGYRTEAELTELLSGISEDIRTDGILNSDTLGSELINHAVSLDTVVIKANLVKQYGGLGIVFAGVNFGKYITHFILHTKFRITGSVIGYPKTGLYGTNLLSLNDTVYYGGEQSLAADLPKGTRLRVVITPLDGALIMYSVSTVHNWSVSPGAGESVVYTAINSGTSCDLKWVMAGGSRFLIEYYESTAATPTRQKIIKI